MKHLIKSKSGVEMSMNVIIIAAIAILIMVILIMFVFRGQQGISTSTACKGGSVEGDCFTSCNDNYPLRYAIGDSGCDEGTYCCIKAGVGDNN